MSALDDFHRRYRAFVEAYAAAPADERERLVAEVLAAGLPDATASADFEPTRRELLVADVALLEASDEFDEFGYMWHNPDRYWNLCGSHEELRHFAAEGWTELRHPTASFDLWFYWNEYLDPRREDLNPLVHYVAEGRRLGHRTVPEIETRALPPGPVAGEVPRRVCLFAAFDLDGIVDDTVIAFLADLSRFADIYYLADCEMQPGELDKVAPYTVGRWAIRHGRYDFGSYSMLARDLVGWDAIEGYDELILANDSGYLVQSFDQVFAKMDAQTADWWGLQGTYEHFTVADHERLGRPLGIDEVQDQMRQLDLWRYSDFIHVGSYFLVYRRRVIDDPGFRRRLDDVVAQTEKTTIILKYEIGFSRFLILRGYQLATFVDGILPYHPVYRETAFSLMGSGFPLLKRQFLYENPFATPDLAEWKARVLAQVPDADVESMETNLHRVAPAWKLFHSFGFRTRPDGTLARPEIIGPDTFDDEDRWLPKHDHWWVFPVDPRSGVMSGEVRAVFEQVRDDATIHKIVLTGSRVVAYGGAHVDAVPAESHPGQMFAMRARTIFVTVGPRADVAHPLSGRWHRFIAMGSPTGLPVPASPLMNLWGVREQPDVGHDNSLVSVAVTASSGAGSRAVETYPRVTADDAWLTGSPRIDLLVQPETSLPASLRKDLSDLRAVVGSRELIVFAPLAIDSFDVDALADWATSRPDLAVALVPPPAWEARVPAVLIDLYDGHSARPETSKPLPVQVEMAWRLAAVVATGWAGDLADLAVPGTPCVALAGAAGTPLPEQDSTSAALASIELALGSSPDPGWLAWGRGLHEASDGRSAARIVRRLRETYLPLADWESEVDELSAG